MATCRNCRTDNPEGFRFCGACGTAFAQLCPSCGAEVPSGFKFCGACGQALGEAPHAISNAARQAPPREPQAERRLVSVLFADLVGFTTLSEHRDPEEVRELLSRYFDTARELIGRYGGVVEKFIGDAVMAVWGTPVAHEDDAERAVRAALDLVDAVTALGAEVGADDLRLRAGVLTGEAAVTIGAEGQGMVAGDLVNTAARLQSAAAPGTVLVGRSTYLSANQAIAFEDAGTHTLKGKELPVEAWRATRVVAGNKGFRKAEALEPPFVGRDQELRQIKDLFHATAREKRPRLVSVMGIGGIGKSRLAWEFFKYIDGLVETTYWHEGRSPAYGEGVTFWALGDMVRMRCRIAETEDDASSRSKLANTVEEYISDPDERRWLEPALAHLLGLEEHATSEREELFAAWRTFFERISEQGPTVLVFEDLQWADPGLIDFVEHLLEWARSHPILIVSLARPELMDKRPNWGAGQRNFVSMYLEPLSDDVMRELLTGLACDLPEDAVRQILDRAEGVPLYAVEMVRMLIDQGRLVAQNGNYRLSGELVRLDVPNTLHGLIAARLDALAEQERTLLQDAAVLGKTFTLDALAALTDGAPELESRLKDLVRKEMLAVDADPRSPERGQYGFVQSLIREVAYNTLSKRDRLSRHIKAAQYFEATGDEELASVVAAHYLEAHRAAPEGPESDRLAAKARESLVTAAERAASLGAHDQALAHLEQALTVTSDAAERAALWGRAADSAANAALYEEAESYLTRAIQWHENQGDRLAAARATADLGRVLGVMGRVEPAIDSLQTALGHLPSTGRDPALAELASALANAYVMKGDAVQSSQWADRALVAAESLDLVRVICAAMIAKGVAMHLGARWRESVALLFGGLALAEDHGLAHERFNAFVNLSSVLSVMNPRRGLEAARQGLALARKLGDRNHELVLAANASVNAIRTGEWDWAERTVTEPYSDALASSSQAWVTTIDATIKAFRGDPLAAKDRLAAVHSFVEASTSPQDLASFFEAEALAALAAGRLEDAHEKATSAIAADPGGEYAIRGYTIAARAALWLRDRERAATAFRRFAETNVHSEWVSCSRRTIHAGLAALEGRPQEGVRVYTDAAKGWRDLNVPFDLALAQLDFVALIGPNDPDARAAASEARDIFTKLGAKPFLARLEAAVASPEMAAR